MPEYNVHLFPVFRIKMERITADDPLKALEKAEERFAQGALTSFINNPAINLENLEGEYADEMSHFLVDTLDDKGGATYKDSVWYGPEYEPNQPDPKGYKAEMLEAILARSEVLPILLGINEDLDKLISERLQNV